MEVTLILLTLISGAAWTYVYVTAIRLGSAQRTYAIPYLALCLNLAWEVLYGIIGLQHATGFSSSLSIQAYIICVWAILDILVLRTFFLYGRSEPPWQGFSWPFFLGIAVFVLIAAASIQLILYTSLGTRTGATYSAFLQNLVMSALFVRLYFVRRAQSSPEFATAYKRAPNRGQSVSLAVAKFIGSLAATLIFGVINEDVLIALVGLTIALLDIIYIALLLQDHASRAPHGTEDLEAA